LGARRAGLKIWLDSGPKAAASAGSILRTARERLVGGDRGTTRTGHVQVWYECEGCDLRLFVTQ
jgi:hypothetical protein